MTMADRDEDDDYFIPLEDQRVFGAGIKRKRIDFVPATTNTSVPNAKDDISNKTSGTSIADRYLSIVMPSPVVTPILTPDDGSRSEYKTRPENDNTCAICKQPLTSNHESTIAHQVCLEHSHPPSHLDRSRHGLRYLSSYGWDPDERRGLGARAEGILHPIKPVPKHDTAGLREKDDVEALAKKVKNRKPTESRKDEKRIMMNAKQVRKQQADAKRKTDTLRNMFYSSDKVEQYLGSG